MKTQFWHHSWVDGEAPRNLAPHLFELVRRKNRSVQQELHNHAWIRALRGRITTATHVEEFVSLWIRLQNIQLQPGIQDSIVWKWTPDGKYSTRSAYQIQFQGSFRKFCPDLIWKAHTENKCKFFAWILIQNKILTADNLQLRNWPHQDHCVMCNGPLESGLHLCLLCPFATEVWSLVLPWEQFDTELIQPQAQPTEISAWWEEAAPKVSRERRRHFNGMVIYTMWNIWKERNRRIFQGMAMDARQVALKAKEDIDMRSRALNNPA